MSFSRRNVEKLGISRPPPDAETDDSGLGFLRDDIGSATTDGEFDVTEQPRTQSVLSLLSWGDDEFERQSTREVEQMLEDMDRLLFEGHTSENMSPVLADECRLWSKRFPHFRVEGRRLPVLSSRPPDRAVVRVALLTEDGIVDEESAPSLRSPGRPEVLSCHGESWPEAATAGRQSAERPAGASSAETVSDPAALIAQMVTNSLVSQLWADYVRFMTPVFQLGAESAEAMKLTSVSRETSARGRRHSDPGRPTPPPPYCPPSAGAARRQTRHPHRTWPSTGRRCLGSVPVRRRPGRWRRPPGPVTRPDTTSQSTERRRRTRAAPSQSRLQPPGAQFRVVAAAWLVYLTDSGRQDQGPGGLTTGSQTGQVNNEQRHHYQEKERATAAHPRVQNNTRYTARRTVLVCRASNGPWSAALRTVPGLLRSERSLVCCAQNGPWSAALRMVPGLLRSEWSLVCCAQNGPWSAALRTVPGLLRSERSLVCCAQNGPWSAALRMVPGLLRSERSLFCCAQNGPCSAALRTVRVLPRVQSSRARRVCDGRRPTAGLCRSVGDAAEQC